MNLEQLVTSNLFQFFLVFARLGSAIMLLPGFGEAYVSPRIRLVFALTVSLALMPMISDRLPLLPAGMGEFAGLLVMEIGIGLFFGMIARLILLGVQTAGSIISLQIGIASALVADPTTQQQAAVTGNFLLALTIVLIFATGLDHMTLKGLVGTYAIFPPGQIPPMSDVADHAARIVADSFAVAMAMTAPFLVYGIVFATALGLLARLMPTLQVFFIAMPAQLLAGFALMAIALTSMMLYFLSAYEERMSLFLGGG
ncbi:flagellar biosynthetic protein FliR [Dongia deserti]|uniref:flagellar biosynthetic protein FliR n=1 Tax=Dongia deserti TaxID=2268030 RepID=UPI000E652CCC|nr:flagellar biosynthetic protein FliR [Dongia deserti]